jgi:hypothetical protein
MKPFLIAALLLALPTVALATSEKVTLCHATGSETNPFVQITVTAAGAFNGHIAHQHAEDIIPPFTFRGETYSQDWPEGQELLEAGCTSSTSVTPSPSLTPTPSVSPSPSPNVTPTPSPSPIGPSPSQPSPTVTTPSLTTSPTITTSPQAPRSTAFTGSRDLYYWGLAVLALLILGAAIVTWTRRER